jgi:hypothetical protein
MNSWTNIGHHIGASMPRLNMRGPGLVETTREEGSIHEGWETEAKSGQRESCCEPDGVWLTIAAHAGDIDDWLSVGEEVEDGRDIKNLEDLDDWLAEGKEDTLEISAPQLQAGKELAWRFLIAPCPRGGAQPQMNQLSNGMPYSKDMSELL